MKDYNNKLEELLKEYDLYETFDELTVEDVIVNILNNIVDYADEYILFADVWTMIIAEKSNIKFKNKYYVDDEKFIEELKNEQIEKNSKILFFSYYMEYKTFKMLLPKNKIINVIEHLPEHLKSKCAQTEFNVTRKIELIDAYSNCEKFNKFLDCEVIKIQNRFNDSPKSIIWGGGYHTKFLLNNTQILKKLKVKYIVDSNSLMKGKYIEGVQIISKDDLLNIDFNTFIISSLQYWREIEKEILDNYKGKFIISPYSNNKEWGSLFNIELEDSNFIENKETLTDKIKLLLSIRDFYNSNKYIDVYIQKEYDKDRKMFNFKNKLNILFEEIRTTIINRKTSNIYFMLIDALDKIGSDNYMKFITKMGEDYINFKNAFSPSTYTNESHLCMFKENYLFDKSTFIRKKIQTSECNFIRELKESGYNIIANNSTRLIDDLIDVNIGKSNTSTPISKMLWDNLCYILNNTHSNNFIYNRFMEHHDTYTIFMYKYIDNQIKYYSQFFNERDYIIISADHGCTVELDKMYHIPLIIKTPDKKKQKVQELFSLKDIFKIIRRLIYQNEFFIENREYVKIERTPIYNEILKKRLESMGGTKYIEAFRIIRTKEDIYVAFENGDEEYYIISNENNNLIFDKKYESRINYLRSIHKDKGFPDFKIDSQYYK